MTSMKKRILLPFGTGLVGMLLLMGIYLGIVSLAESPAHALDLFWQDKALVLPIMLGFGTQVGLYTLLKKGLYMPMRAPAGGATPAAAGWPPSDDSPWCGSTRPESVRAPACRPVDTGGATPRRIRGAFARSRGLPSGAGLGNTGFEAPTSFSVTLVLRVIGSLTGRPGRSRIRGSQRAIESRRRGALPHPPGAGGRPGFARGARRPARAGPTAQRGPVS